MGVRIITGDCRDVLRTLPAESVHCVVQVFRDVRRVLRPDGTVWRGLFFFCNHEPHCRHYLEGQADDEEHLIGIYRVPAPGEAAE